MPSRWQMGFNLAFIGLNERNFSWIFQKDLHYHPYKIQIAQELTDRDMVSGLQFCNEFLDLVKKVQT
jgi:hypothetical protein